MKVLTLRFVREVSCHGGRSAYEYCMGESLIDFVPLHALGQSERAFGTGESTPEDQAEVLPKGAMSTDFRM